MSYFCFMEIWKSIPNYEGYYEASNHGNIRSIERIVPHGRWGKCKQKSKMLRPAKSADGYLKVALCVNGKLHTHPVHRLIAKTFIDSNGLNEVNHIDGNKLNNSVQNLEWCTHSQNVKHAFDTGLAKPNKGSINGNSKLTEQDVIQIRDLWSKRKDNKLMQKDIALIYGVTTSHIKDIVNRRRNIWAHI